MASLRGVDFAKYCDDRLKDCNPATVRRELVVISHLFNTARKLWLLPIDNPVAAISKPPAGRHRERRLSDDEERQLLAAAAESKAPTLGFCITLALETGMRAGEIVSLSWEQVDLANSVIRLDMTKNGERRVVPLTEAAVAAIRGLPRPILGGRVTSFYDSRGLSAAFRRACERAGISGLRFHDLRHEAASRFARRMPVATLAKVMGWKTIQMAMCYYNPTPAELVAAVRAAA
jgi:integrase